MKSYGIGELVQGTQELQVKLERLKKAGTRTAIARRAVNKAADPVVRLAKSLVGWQSTETGLLKLSIFKRVRTYPQTGVVVAVVGPRTGYRRTGRGRGSKRVKSAFFKKMLERTSGAMRAKGGVRTPSKYAHLVEFGTRPHAMGKGSRHPANVRRGEKPLQHGRMHPGARRKPFMRPAWDCNRAQAQSIIRGLVEAGIAAELRKA